MSNSFKNRLKKLSISKKLILAGSGIMVVSAFLPWYSDIDRFKVGDTFLGITGPLYLLGFIVLIAGLASFGLIFLQLLNKKAPKLPLEEGHFHIFNCVLSFLMLVIASSVYFHAKFGINVIDKSAGAGLILAFIATGIVLLGSMLAIRKTEVDFEEEQGHLEPLIEIDEREKVGLKEEHFETATAFDPELDRNATIEESLESANSSTRAWNQLQESIDKLAEDTAEDTKDIK